MTAFLLWEAQPLAGVASQYVYLQFDTTLSERHAERATPTRHPIEEGEDVSDHTHVEPTTVEIEGLVTNHPIAPTAAMDGRDRSEMHAWSAFPKAIPLSRVVRKRVSEPRLIPGRPFPVTYLGIPRPYVAPQFVPPVDLEIDAVPTIVNATVLSASAAAALLGDKFNRTQAVYDALRTLQRDGTVVELRTRLRNYPGMVLTSISAPVDKLDAIAFSLTLESVAFASTERAVVAKKLGPLEPRAKFTEPAGEIAPEPTTYTGEAQRQQLESLFARAAGL